MSVFAVKLPDVGEGIAEAELVEWLVHVGDHVTTESPLAEVLTDKATVEISSPVAGVVTFLHGEPGEMVAVGTEFVGIDVGGAAQPDPTSAVPVDETPVDEAPADEAPAEPRVAEPPAEPRVAEPPVAGPPGSASPPATVIAAAEPDSPTAVAAGSGPADPAGQADALAITKPRPTASPAVRQRARDLGIALYEVSGTGPDGRVVHADLDRHLTSSRRARPSADEPASGDDARVERVRGVRKRIAERVTQAWTEIPHITYVDEVDATNLEELRAELNAEDRQDGTRLTLLPFVVKALVIACREQPRLNAHYDAANLSLSVFDAVHVGIATQAPDGLMVPVLRHAEARGLWDTAAEITRISAAARGGTATRDELSGSTITITSLGALGGLMTTPILNSPEVSIIGVNKMETRPAWRGGAMVPRTAFNLSSSFDHRIVDGWDAATFIQRIKQLLETPALMFVEDER